MSRGSTDPKAEIQRILSTSCHYSVLEVDTTAEEEVIRRAKRTKSLLVHPDKVGNIAGASDAFGKVTDVSNSCMPAANKHDCHNSSMLLQCVDTFSNNMYPMTFQQHIHDPTQHNVTAN